MHPNAMYVPYLDPDLNKSTVKMHFRDNQGNINTGRVFKKTSFHPGWYSSMA